MFQVLELISKEVQIWLQGFRLLLLVPWDDSIQHETSRRVPQFWWVIEDTQHDWPHAVIVAAAMKWVHPICAEAEGNTPWVALENPILRIPGSPICSVMDVMEAAIPVFSSMLLQDFGYGRIPKVPKKLLSYRNVVEQLPGPLRMLIFPRFLAFGAVC